ncbi:UNVERIFIED_ORG: hypothetical protein M2438_002689 [Methylobacterium sp. SuP10 SLI 274]|uniref:hypothetical protein n=1 Tax=Methylorubrum extorquens TaxID=408 RepID=UPI0020A16DF9|nr:hypothetical protein [Methylorubrum extorquens]MDF9863921.1 hypothetical protein [Methylorubrum pseudosasae]MDH6637514.1 hypothetical protein [Methylobacterium sp. SuP10 SLI 274]MDH6666694.1 hypothetical protein [Methylorubrum zatmanii]MCP1558602.1 hypothetical protein [Methylorubrum extorquens]MDF9792231.1 hypothetical protein [Methylorubrum extorquens]
MTAIAPKLATAGRDGANVVVCADGAPVLTLTPSQALWLIARLAEALAVRA